MLVFAAGMRRAGSTVIFNIAKELVETTGRGRALRLQEHNIAEIEKHVNSKEMIVVKAHKFPGYKSKLMSIKDEPKFRILLSVRDIREICGSMMRIKNIGFDVFIKQDFLSEYIDEQQTWKVFKTSYYSKYEDWVGFLFEETRKIADYLNLKVDDVQCMRISEKWSIQNTQKYLETVSGTHHETLLGPGHITSNSAHLMNNYMTNEQLDFLTGKYRWWLKENGYAC